MDLYRISKSRDEITKQLEKKFQDSGHFTIWQKNNEGEREFVIETKFKNFFENDRTFSIFLTKEQFSKANKKAEFYFLLKGHDFVFKSRLAIDQIAGEVRFQLPKEVRLKELRLHPRKYFAENEKINIEVCFDPKSTNKTSDKVQTVCPVLNISVSGICIVVSKETLSQIDLSKEINLKGLGFYENLTSEMKAVVKNARVYIKKNFSSDEFYALGLQFTV